MAGERAYYSLIQFCPDASRLEAANIGVLLYCPGKSFIKAEVSKSTRRVTQFFGKGSFDRAQLNSFKKAFCRRFELERDAFRTMDDVERFIATRANQLRITPLRPLKCADPAAELRSLFDDLVGGHVFHPREKVAFPELQAAFTSPELISRIEFNKEVTVPVLGEIRKIPYAYRNGVWNLIRTCGFTGSEKEALKQAELVSFEKDLFAKFSGTESKGMELVVASRFTPELSSLRPRITNLFEKCKVKHFADNQLGELIEKVRAEASPLT